VIIAREVSGSLSGRIDIFIARDALMSGDSDKRNGE